MNFNIERNPDIDNEEYREFITMNHSSHSYATNNKIVGILNKDSFKDQTCFIVAGGASLENFNFSSLEGRLTIGINKAFLRFEPVLNYAMDSTFYQSIFDGSYDQQEGCRVVDKWLAYKGYKILLSPIEFNQYGKEVYLVKRRLKPIVTKNVAEGIWGGENSAVGAINLAIALGAGPIYLLGYDMKCGEKTHYHNGYPSRDPVEFNQKLQKYKAEIENMSVLWKESGALIYNLGPDSDLTCFPFKDFNNANV